MSQLSTNQAVGQMGENWVYQQLIKQGYSPHPPPDFFEPGHDLVVDGLPIEVKFANRTERYRPNRVGVLIEYPRWQFHIAPPSRAQSEWALILVAEDRQGDRFPYILPGSLIGDRSHIQLTSHPLRYSGWLSCWLNQWDTIGYLADGVYRNGGPLLHEVTA